MMLLHRNKQLVQMLDVLHRTNQLAQQEMESMQLNLDTCLRYRTMSQVFFEFGSMWIHIVPNSGPPACNPVPRGSSWDSLEITKNAKPFEIFFLETLLVQIFLSDHTHGFFP